MATYTDSFQDRMLLYDELNLTFEQKLVKLQEDVFDYDYKNITFKAWFEPFFVQHFFNEEFAFETFDYFKLKLKAKMLEVIPQAEIIYSAFQEITTETFKLSDSMERTKTSEETSSSSESATTVNQKTDDGKEVSSNLPLNVISVHNVSDVSYADFGKINNFKSNSNDTTSNSKKDEHSLNEKEVEKHLVNPLENMQKFANEFSIFSSDLINKFNDLFLIIF